MKLLAKFILMPLSIFGFGGSSSATVKRLSPADAKHVMETEKVTVVDVRTPSEHRSGFITGSINLPLDSIPDNFINTIPDKSTKIFIYCQSGGRSAQASRILVKSGYTDVTDIGGVMMWPYGLKR